MRNLKPFECFSFGVWNLEFAAYCNSMPTKKDMLDLYFIDTRHKLIDVAAFLDRIDRHEGDVDFRLSEFNKAIEAMLNPGEHTRTEAVLLSLSDPSSEPIATAPMQGALGAAEPSAEH